MERDENEKWRRARYDTELMSLHRFRRDAVNVICVDDLAVVWEAEVEHAVVSKVLNGLEGESSVPGCLQD